MAKHETILEVVRDLLILNGFVGAFGRYADEMKPDQIRDVANEVTKTLEVVVAKLETFQ